MILGAGIGVQFGWRLKIIRQAYGKRNAVSERCLRSIAVGDFGIVLVAGTGREFSWGLKKHLRESSRGGTDHGAIIGDAFSRGEILCNVQGISLLG